MRRSTVALQHHFQPFLYNTSPAPLLPSTCLRCYAEPRLTSSRPRAQTLQHPHRAFTTTPLQTQSSSTNPSRAPDPSTSPNPSPAPQTHYDLFPTILPHGPPPAGPFSIDVRALKRAFLQLQAKAHPDHHPPALKARAEATSARLSEAFRTLEDPLARARYLLGLRGIDVEGDEGTMFDTPGDQGLLAEVMEGQEVIEEAESAQELEGLQRVNQERLALCVKRLGELFERDDIEGAAREAVRLRYWVNIREGIREFEPGKEVRLVH